VLERSGSLNDTRLVDGAEHGIDDAGSAAKKKAFN